MCRMLQPQAPKTIRLDECLVLESQPAENDIRSVVWFVFGMLGTQTQNGRSTAKAGKMTCETHIPLEPQCGHSGHG